MSTTNDDEVLDEGIQFLKKGLKYLAIAKNGKSRGLDARRQLGNEVLSDARMGTIKALEHFFDTVVIPFTGSSATRELRSAWIARLLESGFVNILFCCLPKPEAFERSMEDGSELRRIYVGFKEFMDYLFAVIGRKELEDFCDDPLLGGLFTTVDRAGAASSARLAMWKDELRRLAWETRGCTQDSTYSPLTVRLLEYLCWDVKGRKDKSRCVQKLVKAVDLGTLRRTAQRDLSRLPEYGLIRNCASCSAPGAKFACDSCFPEEDESQAIGTAYCGSACFSADSTTHALICEETSSLSRRAQIFQITFVQYLISINFGTTFVVSEQDGVVHLSLSDAPASPSTIGSHYVGVSPGLDLSLPSVEAALHGFHCCDIKVKARALLEYFFGGECNLNYHQAEQRMIVMLNFLWKTGFCDSIKFVNFVPKNAHTTLEVERDEWFRFNMSALHTVAQLTTRSGRNFILDPTATQFGWKENLVPWETYAPYRIEFYHFPEVKAHDPPRTPTEHTLRPESEAGRSNWTSKVVAENILEVSEALLVEKGGLDRILQLPQDEFQELCWELKENIEPEMRHRDNMRIASQYQGA